MTALCEFIESLNALSDTGDDFELLGQTHNAAIFREALFKEAQVQMDAALKSVYALEETLRGGGS